MPDTATVLPSRLQTPVFWGPRETSQSWTFDGFVEGNPNAATAAGRVGRGVSAGLGFLVVVPEDALLQVVDDLFRQP